MRHFDDAKRRRCDNARARRRDHPRLSPATSRGGALMRRSVGGMDSLTRHRPVEFEAGAIVTPDDCDATKRRSAATMRGEALRAGGSPCCPETMFQTRNGAAIRLAVDPFHVQSKVDKWGSCAVARVDAWAIASLPHRVTVATPFSHRIASLTNTPLDIAPPHPELGSHAAKLVLNLWCIAILR